MIREVSSFRGVGIEWIPLYTEVSSFHRVGIEEFHYTYRGVLISWDWNREGSIVYRGVFISWDIGIEGFYTICRGVLISGY